MPTIRLSVKTMWLSIGCTSWREEGRRFIVHVLLALEGSLEPAIGIRDKNEELRKERSSTVQNAFCESRQDRNGKSDLLQIPTNRPSRSQYKMRKLLDIFGFVPKPCRHQQGEKHPVKVHQGIISPNTSPTTPTIASEQAAA